MGNFNPEEYISDETFEKVKNDYSDTSIHDWAPETKKEFYAKCLTPEARQQIFFEYFIKELDRIADKIIEAVKT